VKKKNTQNAEQKQIARPGEKPSISIVEKTSFKIEGVLTPIHQPKKKQAISKKTIGATGKFPAWVSKDQNVCGAKKEGPEKKKGTSLALKMVKRETKRKDEKNVRHERENSGKFRKNTTTCKKKIPNTRRETRIAHHTFPTRT